LITMPFSLEEYHVGHTYMRSRMQMENTKGREGVEVIASEPFKDDVLGEGHYSHVVHHFQGRAPAWIRALAPLKALRLEEKNWNAYPRSRMELSCPYFTNFKIVVDTYHLADRGDADNAHRALYLEAYRKCYAWADEWCELTVADARRIEQENIDSAKDDEAFSDAMEDAVEGEEDGEEEEGVFKSVTALLAVAPVAA
ncbi:unnamed protein product, partial [Closterium sp. Naga37s-1]